MNIIVSENLSDAPKSPYRFCATLGSAGPDVRDDEIGFGPTEERALRMLADLQRMIYLDLIDGAEIERIAIR